MDFGREERRLGIVPGLSSWGMRRFGEAHHRDVALRALAILQRLSARPLDERRFCAYMSAMDELYHPRILELAADIPHLGRLSAPGGTARKVSRVCGSIVTVDVVLDGEQIKAIAVEPEACALGQASAAILSGSAIGATIAEVLEARDALRAMLKDNGPPPVGRFWELRHLSGVAGYPPRHASTLLAFEAAAAAIAEAQHGVPSRGAVSFEG